MKNLENMDVTEITNEILGQSFTCPQCGKIHSVDTISQVISENLIFHMNDEILKLGLKGKALIVCDKNTYKAAGKELVKNIKGAEIFTLQGDNIHADQNSIGRLIIELVNAPDYLIACGSGTITDIVRYTAFITKLPFIVFATAASVDGFASGSTPLIVDGFKSTYLGKAPLGVFADTKILSNAPRKMIAAGFGDILAKIPSMLDWRLAHDVEGEPFCPLIYLLVEKSVEECIKLADDIAKADPQACGKLMSVLSLTGIAMQMMGTTRPASGGEHQISHLFEMSDIQLGRTGRLHGDKVGIGTLVSLYIYLKMFGEHSFPQKKETMPPSIWEEEIKRVYGKLAKKAIKINRSQPPTGEEEKRQEKILKESMEEYGFAFIDKYCSDILHYAQMIKKMGGPIYAHELGYSKEETYDAIAFAKEVRPKYSILRIAEGYGLLYDFAKEISQDLNYLDNLKHSVK